MRTLSCTTPAKSETSLSQKLKNSLNIRSIRPSPESFYEQLPIIWFIKTYVHSPHIDSHSQSSTSLTLESHTKKEHTSSLKSTSGNPSLSYSVGCKMQDLVTFSVLHTLEISTFQFYHRSIYLLHQHPHNSYKNSTSTGVAYPRN